MQVMEAPNDGQGDVPSGYGSGRKIHNGLAQQKASRDLNMSFIRVSLSMTIPSFFFLFAGSEAIYNNKAA